MDEVALLVDVTVKRVGMTPSFVTVKRALLKYIRCVDAEEGTTPRTIRVRGEECNAGSLVG